MASEVRLDPGLVEGRWAFLREMNGQDEMALQGESRLDALLLLDRLLLAMPGTSVGPGSTAALSLSDRDRLLAAVYRAHFGDRVEGSGSCQSCQGAFELSFSLDALMAAIFEEAETRRGAKQGQRPAITGPDARGVYQSHDGMRFRPPTSLDLDALRGLPRREAREALAKACLIEAPAEADLASLAGALSAVAPLIDRELDAACSECGAHNTVHFDIQSHLLRSLRLERRFLSREVHCLARAYGWSLGDILSLPRRERATYVRLVLRERDAREARH